MKDYGWLGVGDSEKIILRCYLIEFGEFTPQKKNLPSPPLRKLLPSGEYILYIATDFLDIPK